MMKRHAGLLIFGMLPATALAQPVTPPDFSGSYFCKAAASGGVKFDTTQKKWVPATFDVSDVSYVVSATQTGKTEPDATFGLPTPTYNISVKDFGSEGDSRECFAARRAGTSSKDIRIDDFGYGNCIFMGYDYEFNFKSQRMQVMFRGGFMDDWRENTDTPYVAVAQCEKIS